MHVPIFLALLDYVSRPHEMEIRHSSIRRPPVSQLSLYLLRGVPSSLSCCFPWAIRWNFFFNF